MGEGIGIFLFLILLVEESGVPMPIPGDVLLLVNGIQIAKNPLLFPFYFICSVLSVLIGATILFAIAKHGGRPLVLKFGRYIGITRSRLATVEGYFQGTSHYTLTIVRFLPGMRVIGTAVAGILDMSYRAFIIQVTIASSLWVGGLLMAGAVLGDRVENIQLYIGRYWYLFLLLLIVPFITSFLVMRKRKGKKKR
jgi:membrane protein DedA with SNARE-associated domain